MTDPEDLTTAVRTLSRLLLAEETLETTLDRVASLACRTLAPCDLASVTLVANGRPTTPAHTSPEVDELDRAQYRSQRGPCLEAYDVRQVVRRNIADGRSGWPEFTAAAESYTDADEENAVLFSEQAAVACANAEVYWRTHALTEHLREALESRDVIGQAKGILMARRRCTPDAAFEALRRASQHRNVKLRQVAEQVVYLGDFDD